MRILVAEDDRDMNAILVSRLKKEHYSVDTERADKNQKRGKSGSGVASDSQRQH